MPELERMPEPERMPELERRLPQEASWDGLAEAWGPVRVLPPAQASLTVGPERELPQA
jgi:hypothetical protein